MSDPRFPQNLLSLLQPALRLWICRRVSFRKDLADHHLVESGKEFVAFRMVVVTRENKHSSG